MKMSSNFLAVACGKIINTPLMLIESVLIAKIFGPDNFGQWSLILAAAALLHSIFFNWTYSVNLKFGCSEWAECRSLNSTLSNKIPFVFLGLFFCFYITLVDPYWVNMLYSIDSRKGMIIFVCIINMWLMFETQSCLQVSGLFTRQAMLSPIITSASVFFLLYCASAGYKNFYYILLFLTIIKNIFWCGNYIFFLKKNKFHWQQPGYDDVRKVFLFGFPLIPALLFGYLSDWGDHLLINFFCSPREVGIWAMSYQIMLGIIAINSVLVTVLLPWLLSSKNSILETAKFYIDEIIPVLVSVWLVIVIMVVIFSQNILSMLLGSKYAGCNEIIPILNIAVLTNIFSSLYGPLYTLENRLKRMLFYDFIMIAINFPISCLLIPRIGVKGAAIGTVISYAVVQFMFVCDQHFFLKKSLYKITMLFSLTILIGFMQYLIGFTLEGHSICFFISIILLILITKKFGIKLTDLKKLKYN